MVSFHLRSECAAHLTRVADVPSLQMSLKLTLPVHELLQALTDATKAQIQAPVPVDGCIVRVSNVMKRLNAEDLKGLFEEVVGPVEKVQVQQSHALVTFAKEEDAQRLIERFDGAILELPERPGAKARAWPLQQGIFAQCLEEHLGPLDLCQLLRGPGFAVSSRYVALARKIAYDLSPDRTHQQCLAFARFYFNVTGVPSPMTALSTVGQVT
eukprot:g141.t1